MAGNQNSGRTPKPTAQKRLSGTLRKDRENRAEPQMSGSPDHGGELSGDALDLWNRIVPELTEAGIAKSIDSTQLVVMCEWWGRYQCVKSALDSDVPSLKDFYRLGILSGMFWKNFDAIAIRFGLDPVSRSRLKTGVPTAEDDDPLVALMKRRGLLQSLN